MPTVEGDREKKSLKSSQDNTMDGENTYYIWNIIYYGMNNSIRDKMSMKVKGVNVIYTLLLAIIVMLYLYG